MDGLFLCFVLTFIFGPSFSKSYSIDNEVIFDKTKAKHTKQELNLKNKKQKPSSSKKLRRALHSILHFLSKNREFNSIKPTH